MTTTPQRIRRRPQIGQTVLIARAAESSGIPQVTVKKVLAALIGEISAAVTDGDLVIMNNFVVFERSWREERMARNPQSGDQVQIPAKYVVRARVMDSFKAKVADQAPSRSLKKKYSGAHSKRPKAA
jgi:DNA-binding protein HU-beta